jgi:hypothetical protein
MGTATREAWFLEDEKHAFRVNRKALSEMGSIVLMLAAGQAASALHNNSHIDLTVTECHRRTWVVGTARG